MIDTLQLSLGLYDVSLDVGSEAWWEDIRSLGTPLFKAQNDGKSLVFFIWQDPQGDESRSNTASVLLNVNSLTNHHSWIPSCLSRVHGTDIWLGQLVVNSKWRGSYSFIPLQANQLPDIARKCNDSRESQRAWWIDVASNQIPDDLNTLPMQVSGWGMASPLHLPNAPVELGWKEWEQGHLFAVSASQIHSVNWQSSILENERNCSVFSTAIGDAPLVILLDGQKWGAASGTLSVLQYLTDTKRIAPAHYLLIPSIDGRTRWKELSCYRLFWQALIDELLPKVKTDLAKSKYIVSDYLVAGQSLGGLSALFAGLYFSDYFSKVISLSGSFWWPEENRMRTPEPFESIQVSLPINSLAERILNDYVGVQHLQAFLTVGTGEDDMRLYNNMTYQAIKKKGGDVHYENVCGGHDWVSWRSSLMNGLVHLIPTQA